MYKKIFLFVFIYRTKLKKINFKKLHKITLIRFKYNTFCAQNFSKNFNEYISTAKTQKISWSICISVSKKFREYIRMENASPK